MPERGQVTVKKMSGQQQDKRGMSAARQHDVSQISAGCHQYVSSMSEWYQQIATRISERFQLEIIGDVKNISGGCLKVAKILTVTLILILTVSHHWARYQVYVWRLLEWCQQNISCMSAGGRNSKPSWWRLESVSCYWELCDCRKYQVMRLASCHLRRDWSTDSCTSRCKL